jgi:hypothetical protein
MDPLLLAIIIAFVLAIVSSSSYSSAPEKPKPRAQPKDTIILLITGGIIDPNIKEVDFNIQLLLKKDNLAFSQAVAYDKEMLLKLDQVRVPSKEPKESAYVGPLLKDVLKNANPNLKANPELLHLRSLMGVSRMLTRKELDARRWVLALKRGDTPLMIGANGPLLLVYEPESGSTFTADDEKAWLPAIFYIDVR